MPAAGDFYKGTLPHGRAGVVPQAGDCDVWIDYCDK